MNLLESSFRRAELPLIPGATVVDRLANGRAVAQTILLKYRPNMSFSATEASRAVRDVEVWQNRNSAELELAMDSSSSSLPEAIRLGMSRKAAQDYVIAVFTQAALGMGPWTSGKIAAIVASGYDPAVDAPWARDDADARLAIFAGIAKLEETGYLAKLFSKDEALGNPAIIAGVVVAVVLVAALFIYYNFAAKKLELNNRVMADLCRRAQEQGDKATVDECVKQSAGLQKDPLATDIIGGVTKVALVLGGIYVAGLVAMKFVKERALR